ncbi:IucA/IucC family C-terminal-domain containing protein [Oceanospirillum beijerinckii]|uniref:IucA/IucC family C-terminal-domain containing protein n=1 Tax=Oceanospirillum beijerinckii TaxID=64976 RepID=UPI0003FBB984|nr:IucA/IucC family C-terminal-domain containing protein [Oceanospirillum beijerinckii]
MTELYQPEVLEKLLTEFAKHYPGRKSAAIVSQWSMNYMSVCLPSCLIPVVALQRGVRIWQEPVSFVVSDDMPQSLWLVGQEEQIPREHLHQYYHDLLDLHLGQLFPVLARVGRVSDKMLWSNCALIWDYLFYRLSATPELTSVAEDAMSWWYQTELAESQISLDYFLSLVDSPVPEIRPQLPLRSHCCLHFRLHDRVKGQMDVLCESCPKLHRKPLEQQIRYLNEIYEDCD